MNPLSDPSDPICWLIIAPLDRSSLERVAIAEWQQLFPVSIDPVPWELVSGTGRYSGLASRLPGSEGTDQPIAQSASRLAGSDAVYSLWLDPEREAAFAWRNGHEVPIAEADPLALAESLGFLITPQATPKTYGVAVVEGATEQQVRSALADASGLGAVEISRVRRGILIASTTGDVGTRPWDVASKLPKARVYLVQRWPKDEVFEVSILQGDSETGVLRLPPVDGDWRPILSDIEGAHKPFDIVTALGVPPALLGME